MDSTWIVNTNLTAVQVRDRLRAQIDANDELLVAAISEPAAWYGFTQKGSDWLKANPDNDWTLPQEIVDKTIAKYLQAYEMLTGKQL